MEISVKERGNVNILELDGKLDLANAAVLKDKVKRLLAGKKTHLHLDLTHVDFINSSGLGALVSIMKEIRMFKGRLTLSNLAPYVKEIFDITQLSHVFEMFNNVEDALANSENVTTPTAG